MRYNYTVFSLQCFKVICISAMPQLF